MGNFILVPPEEDEGKGITLDTSTSSGNAIQRRTSRQNSLQQPSSVTYEHRLSQRSTTTTYKAKRTSSSNRRSGGVGDFITSSTTTPSEHYIQQHKKLQQQLEEQEQLYRIMNQEIGRKRCLPELKEHIDQLDSYSFPSKLHSSNRLELNHNNHNNKIYEAHNL